MDPPLGRPDSQPLDKLTSRKNSNANPNPLPLP